MTRFAMLCLTIALTLLSCTAPSNPSAQTAAVAHTTLGRSLGYKVVDSLGQSYYVFLNADSSPKTFTADVDLTTAAVVVDQVSAGVTAIAHPVGLQVSGKTITLAPGTSAVLKR